MTALHTLVSVVGARPQFVKLAPVSRALDETGIIEHVVLHTGQHYDANMSDSFFEQLGMRAPDLNLEIGSGSHAQQTGEMLTGIENYLVESEIDAVLTYGDTNSTLAASLAASKIHVPVAHIEAGLRSFNRSMPEEINRLVADHCSDRLYAPTPLAMTNLESENLVDRAVWTGDVMLDAVLHNAEVAAERSNIMNVLDLRPGQFGLVTIHRPVNTTVTELARILESLDSISTNHLKLVFPVHPRTRASLDRLGRNNGGNLLIVDPLPYFDSIAIIQAAALVITDSGGVQKEAAFLRTPCITVRDESEWKETVELGVNRLVSATGDQLAQAGREYLAGADPFDRATLQSLQTHFGVGDASKRIAEDCVVWLDRIQSGGRKSVRKAG